MVRGAPASFEDHFSQAALFYDSLTDIEKQHIAAEVEQFERGRNPGDAAADDRHLRTAICH